MQSWRKSLWAGLLTGSMLAVVASAGSQSKPAGKAATKTETGYVVSLSETGCVLSNIPAGSGGAPGPGGGPGPGGQPVVVSRTVTQSEGGAPGKAPGKTVISESQPGKQTMQVQLGPGDVVTGPDGKRTLSAEARKRLTPEQQKMIEDSLQGAAPGGPIVVLRGGDGKEGNVRIEPAKTAGANVPLKFTEFTVDKKTKKPAGLEHGDKVKITYAEVDGKKIVMRIEKTK